MNEQNAIKNLNEAGLSKTNLARLCENSYNFNNIIVFCKYLKQTISTNQNTNLINIKDLICKNNMKNLFKLKNNKNKNQVFNIILEVNEDKRKIKILKLKNNMNYIADLLVFIEDHLKISITGSCAISLKHKIKLHYNEVNPINSKSKSISLCIPKIINIFLKRYQQKNNEERYQQKNNFNFTVGTIFINTPIINTQRGGVILPVAASAAVGSPTAIAIIMTIPILMIYIGLPYLIG